jgi:hypothetical protein
MTVRVVHAVTTAEATAAHAATTEAQEVHVVTVTRSLLRMMATTTSQRCSKTSLYMKKADRFFHLSAFFIHPKPPNQTTL